MSGAGEGSVSYPHLNLHRPGMGRIPADKRLLIHTEQGLGDTLQFCRYLPMLRERGASLVFTVQQPLRSLIASSMPWLELGDGLPSSSNAQCRLLSLPHLLKTTLDTIPAPIPYIHPPEQAIASMGKIIGRGAELKVGLVWAGSPTHLFDKERSLTFAALAPILSVENIRFFSLQTGAAAREAPTGATDSPPSSPTSRKPRAPSPISISSSPSTRQSRTSRAPWTSQSGSCCPLFRIGAGFSNARTAPGIRQRVCSVKRRMAIGSR